MRFFTRGGKFTKPRAALSLKHKPTRYACRKYQQRVTRCQVVWAHRAAPSQHESTISESDGTSFWLPQLAAAVCLCRSIECCIILLVQRVVQMLFLAWCSTLQVFPACQPTAGNSLAVHNLNRNNSQVHYPSSSRYPSSALALHLCKLFPQPARQRLLLLYPLAAP
jgi:hypothetical protein